MDESNERFDCRASKPTYARRRPETTALYQVVRDNLLTLYAAAEDGFASPLPGFVRHAATTARAGDAAGREALCKYVLRPPIAGERVQLLGNDVVSPVGDHEARRLVLKRPFSDGTFALDLDPLALLVRLATTVPPPGFHTIRYAGVLAPASKWRAPRRVSRSASRVVPPPPPSPHSDDGADCAEDCPTCSAKAKDTPPTHRSGYRPWRELLMRAFKIDLEHCDKCGGRLKLRALVMTTAGIERRAS